MKRKLKLEEEAFGMSRRIKKGKPSSVKPGQKDPHGTAKKVKVSNEKGIVPDISNNKHLVEKLSESEERFRTLFETMVLGVVYQDPDGRILDANPAAERILGLSLGQMQGRFSSDPRWHAIHEDGSDFPGETHASMVALRTGKIIKDIVMGVFHPQDKKYVWININAVPMFKQGENRPYQVYSTFEDITERIHAVNELRSSEEKYRGLMESLDNAVAIIDKNGRFLFMNKVAANIIGKPVDILTGKTMHELFPRAEADRQMGNIHMSLRENRVLSFENLSTIDGIPTWFKTTILPVHDETGNITQALINSVDITKIKKVQQDLEDLNLKLEEKVRERTAQLQDLYDNAPVGYHSLDINGYFSAVNQTELDWLGYTLEELSGKHVTTILNSDAAEIFRESFPLLKSKGKIEGIEFNILRKDGTTFPVEFNATVIFDKKGNFVGTRSIIRDISLRKKAEEARNKAVIEAEIANRAKSEFLLNVGHEFRTPLNAVLGYAELLENAEGADRKTYAESLKASGRKLLTLVNDILDLIGSEKGEMELSDEIVEIYGLFRDIQLSFAGKIMEKGLKFTTNISPDLPAYITIDRTRLKQVVTNLLNNAVKFTDKGEVALNIFTSQNIDTDDKINLVIEVRDTGKGISEDFQKKMFEAFSQAEKKTVLNGAGIGLALSQIIVNKMNGSMHVSSEPGVGSSFIVTIPVIPSVSSGRKDSVQEEEVFLSEMEKTRKEAIKDYNTLIETLEGNYLVMIRNFEVRQPIREVRKFGQSLTELGTRHHCRMISDYGRELTKAADSFNIEGMLKLIRRYKDLINNLKN